MNDRSEPQLLDEVLAESSPPDCRAALLDETLRQVRLLRRRRQMMRAGGVLAVAVLAALFAWQEQPVKKSFARPVAKMAAARSYQLVETRPLPAGALVGTKDFARVQMISSEATVRTVATGRGGFRFISDEQLLVLVGPRPAILIRTGPDSEELVFAEPADLPKGRPAN
jgi:hypothetical protein